ncbi:uncharacterized protein M6B38_340825 [Iris pallida]|uniref:Mitochondrial glycoprotein n=1 Tax=Iris pallida TaxID=29817 RepID=A0AAX6GWJ6_IRIPA|nr:uncharacterized protein M6B38_385440 [Iris pallida]KAJ6833109.1 uncharacterized protein M6B38_340825 [Iris pallida]
MASSLLRRTALRRSFSSSFSMLRCYSASAFSLSIRRGIVPQNPAKNPSFFPLRFASSKVKEDEVLKRVLEAEIECQENQIVHGQVAEIPKEFPFDIIDNPGDRTIILKREFSGEKIHVTVLMNDVNEVENDEDEVEKNEDGGEDDEEPITFSLVVNIDKGHGSTAEFSCDLSSSELIIERIGIKRCGENDDETAYDGPEFTDLDESLQNALYRYLKARGIKASLFDPLFAYMINKDDREYLLWLKNMKEFVEK